KARRRCMSRIRRLQGPLATAPSNRLTFVNQRSVVVIERAAAGLYLRPCSSSCEGQGSGFSDVAAVHLGGLVQLRHPVIAVYEEPRGQCPCPTQHCVSSDRARRARLIPSHPRSRFSVTTRLEPGGGCAVPV